LRRKNKEFENYFCKKLDFVGFHPTYALVLLLNAGDKSKQPKDIELAKTYLKDIKDNKND